MEGRANGSDVHAPPVPTERPRRLKAVICASAIQKFQMQGTALSPGRHRSGRRMGGAFEKSGQNAAQRRKGGVVLEPHKNSFPKNSLVFVLPVSFAVLPAACGYESGGSPDAPAAA